MAELPTTNIQYYTLKEKKGRPKVSAFQWFGPEQNKYGVVYQDRNITSLTNADVDANGVAYIAVKFYVWNATKAHTQFLKRGSWIVLDDSITRLGKPRPALANDLVLSDEEFRSKYKLAVSKKKREVQRERIT